MPSSCKFLFPLIIPILVIYHDAELNDIVYIQVYVNRFIDIGTDKFSYFKNQNGLQYKNLYFGRLFLSQLYDKVFRFS